MKYSIDYDRAYNAYRNTSFSPERRANDEQQIFIDIVTRTRSSLESLAVSDEQKAAFEDMMEKFEKGLYDRTNALLDANSRTASSAITGGSNFPVERNRKRMDIADKRREEYLSYIEYYPEKIKKVLKRLVTEEVKNQENMDKAMFIAKEILATVKELHKGYSKSAFTTNAKGRLTTLVKNGHYEAFEKALEYIKENQDPKNKVFAANNGIWKLVDEYKAKDEIKAQKPSVQVIQKYDGAIIELHNNDDRVRIFFDEKPGDDIRFSLKSSGWRFSRNNNNAWQRKATSNAVYSAKNIVGKYFDVIDKEESC